MHVHHDPAGFEPGNREQVLDEVGEPIRVLLDGLEESRGDLGIIFRAVNESLDVALDHGKRRAQFMADVGEELRFQLVQLAQLAVELFHLGMGRFQFAFSLAGGLGGFDE